jgi:hypothetical protein
MPRKTISEWNRAGGSNLNALSLATSHIYITPCWSTFYDLLSEKAASGKVTAPQTLLRVLTLARTFFEQLFNSSVLFT